MKKCLLLVAAAFLAATWTAAEAIDAVSFNPARLGRYENLKISGGLTSKGGISAQAVTVQSGGTVTFNNAGNYQADRTEVQGTLNMPNTDFNTTTLYSSGPASFVGSGTSQIGNMIGASMRVQANRMALRQVSVSGEATTDYNGNSISGFVLGNNTIPTAPSECQGLQWVTRVTDDNQSYKVLGFASCGTEESTEQDCTENPNQEKCCTTNQEWNGTECVTKSCPNPPGAPSGCGSCYFTYNGFIVKGFACPGWNTTTCEWDDAYSSGCRPNTNVWVSSYTMTQQIGGNYCNQIWGTSKNILSSRPTLGAYCGTYGAANSKTQYYFPQAPSNLFTCEIWQCSNIATTKPFQRGTP